MKVMTWNIEAGIGTTKGILQYSLYAYKYLFPSGKEKIIKRVGEHIAKEKPDILGVQECDTGSMRTGYQNQSEYLEGHLPLYNKKIGSSIKTPFFSLDNMVYSRYPLSGAEELVLPGWPGPRSAVSATVHIKQRKVSVIVVHLSINTKVRIQQLLLLAKCVRRHTHPTLVIGDFNTGPKNKEMISFLSHAKLKIADPKKGTFFSWNPHYEYDMILHSHSIRCVRAKVLHVKLSDHLPVIAELELP